MINKIYILEILYFRDLTGKLYKIVIQFYGVMFQQILYLSFKKLFFAFQFQSILIIIKFTFFMSNFAVYVVVILKSTICV